MVNNLIIKGVVMKKLIALVCLGLLFCFAGFRGAATGKDEGL